MRIFDGFIYRDATQEELEENMEFELMMEQNYDVSLDKSEAYDILIGDYVP